MPHPSTKSSCFVYYSCTPNFTLFLIPVEHSNTINGSHCEGVTESQSPSEIPVIDSTFNSSIDSEGKIILIA